MSLHNFTGDRQDWRAFDRQQLGEPDPNFYATHCQGCDSELDADGFCRPCSTPAEIAERVRAERVRGQETTGSVSGAPTPRLSGEPADNAPADHGASSRSSEGVGNFDPVAQITTNKARHAELQDYRRRVKR